MADIRDDYELRGRAVELHEAGVGFQAILHRLGRSRAWLAKWLHRFRTEGWQGLRSRSRAPKQQARQMPQRIVARVVAIRAELEARQTRRSRFSGIGARWCARSCNAAASDHCPPSVRLNDFSASMAIPSDRLTGGLEAGNRILRPARAFPAMCSRLTWWGHGICVAPRASHASTRRTRWPWWAAAPQPPKAGTRPRSCSVSISSRPGVGWACRWFPRWTMKWPPPVGAVTLTGSPWSCGCTSCWASGCSSSHPANRGGMPMSRVLMACGRSGSCAILVRICGRCAARIMRSSGTITSRSHTGPCGVRQSAPATRGSGCSASAASCGVCQRASRWGRIEALVRTCTCPWPEGGSPGSGVLTQPAPSKSTARPTPFAASWSASMSPRQFLPTTGASWSKPSADFSDSFASRSPKRWFSHCCHCPMEECESGSSRCDEGSHSLGLVHDEMKAVTWAMGDRYRPRQRVGFPYSPSPIAPGRRDP